MRILFASLGVSYPPSSGHSLHNWALLCALVEEGHEVTLVSFAEPHETNQDGSVLRQMCSAVDLVPTPLTRMADGPDYLGRLRALVSPLPYAVRRFQSTAFTACLRRHLARERFDVVICDEVYNLPNLPTPLSVPVLVDTHHIGYVFLARYLEYERNLLRRAYARTEYWKMRRWEIEACSRVAGLIACSELERGELERVCPGAWVTMVPNVVDVDSYTPTADRNGSTLLYMGDMRWYPNQDAVEFFLTAILPELRRLVPDAKFVAAGRGPSAEFQRRFASVPGVEFTGTVPDMRAEIAKATISVVPLRIGSGTRFKILEAAAMGKAIVSTRMGAEGLEFIDGEEILLSDEPKAFAQAVASLLTDGSRRRAIAQAARRRVEQQYSLPVLHTTLRQSLALLAEKARAVNAR